MKGIMEIGRIITENQAAYLVDAIRALNMEGFDWIFTRGFKDVEYEGEYKNSMKRIEEEIRSLNQKLLDKYGYSPEVKYSWIQVDSPIEIKPSEMYGGHKFGFYFRSDAPASEIFVDHNIHSAEWGNPNYKLSFYYPDWITLRRDKEHRDGAGKPSYVLNTEYLPENKIKEVGNMIGLEDLLRTLKDHPLES